MQQATRQDQRRALYLWVKWAPVLLLFFGVLFFDTWLNTQTRNSDYELCRLRKRMQELATAFEDTRAAVAGRETMDWLSGKASDFELVDPEPGQVEIVYYDALPAVLSPVDPLVMARLEGRTRPLMSAMAPVSLPPVVSGAVAAPEAAIEPLPSEQGEEGAPVEASPVIDGTGFSAVHTDAAAAAQGPIILAIPRESFEEELLLDDSLGNLLGAL